MVSLFAGFFVSITPPVFLKSSLPNTHAIFCEKVELTIAGAEPIYAAKFFVASILELYWWGKDFIMIHFDLPITYTRLCDVTSSTFFKTLGNSSFSVRLFTRLLKSNGESTLMVVQQQELHCFEAIQKALFLKRMCHSLGTLRFRIFFKSHKKNLSSFNLGVYMLRVSKLRYRDDSNISSCHPSLQVFHFEEFGCRVLQVSDCWFFQKALFLKTMSQGLGMLRFWNKLRITKLNHSSYNLGNNTRKKLPKHTDN